MIRRLGAGLVIAVGLACGSDNPSGANGSVTPESGMNQTAAVGTALQPFSVKVTDGADPDAGVTVSWSVVVGGGGVAPATSVTDAGGIAGATATLGTVVGSQVVKATASGYSPAIFTTLATAGPAATIAKDAGDDQFGFTGSALPEQLQVRVQDQYDNPVPNASVSWAVAAGGGNLSPTTTTTNVDGRSSTTYAFGTTPGDVSITASVAGAGTVTFAAKGIVQRFFTILAGGNNVHNRSSVDLWVKDGYAYTGTYPGSVPGVFGNVVLIWQLVGSGAPVLYDSIITPNVGAISDIQVSDDGGWLAFTTEGGTGSGLYVYQLTSPGVPVFRAKTVVSGSTIGLHTGTLATIGGTLYDFAARDPSGCALEIYDLSQAGSGIITEASATPIPENYCIHDTFVRDGYVFVFAWDEGLYIFDVGNGSHGGSPTHPVQISHTKAFGGETHNGWWFWNPNGEKKYLFIGQEGPSNGGNASGDIHVVDVSNFAAPVEVGFYHMANAGTHNFWVDETNQILYAAYYNGGVVALDISGTITGSMASRELARIRPGGNSHTFTWGVMLYNGSVYASDMSSGFYQLSEPH